MSRAAWAGLLMLGAGLGLAAYFLTRGIDESTLVAVEATEQAVAGDEASLERAHDEFVKIIRQDPSFLEGQGDVKAAQKSFEQRKAKMAEARAILNEKIPPLVKSGEWENNDRIVELARTAATTASSAVSGVSANVGVARTLLDYKTRHTELMDAARTRLASAADGADEPLKTRLALAATQYPEVKPKLDARMAKIGEQATQLRASSAKLEALAAAPSIDYVAAGKTADAIILGGKALDKMRADLESDVAQLSKSVDKILVDMQEENGQFQHKYKIVENGVARETGWEAVTRGVYQQHRDHLGMTLYSKPEGVLPEDAEKVAAPPGYNYVGNTRYGYWEQRNGQSFWVFYGKYSLMRDLLWGPGRYSSVPRGSYRSYRTTVKTGKPFYGATKQYGTKGTYTKTRYAGSSYYKQERKRTYSSSRYSGSSGSRRYSSSSYGGGSRRSGGSRGSRYRSSSFGGGGK